MPKVRIRRTRTKFGFVLLEKFERIVEVYVYEYLVLKRK